MSEYWKSTPKYWCKHCKVYIKDTKLERTNHDATPRHQGNLKRFLRDLHRSHENEEREKERAKNEVARLKGLTAAGGSGAAPNTSSVFGGGGGGGGGGGPSTAYAPRVPQKQVTNEDRKKQAAQLLELGIGVPDEFRGELAIPGEWRVTSTRVISEEGEDVKPKRPEAMGIGVRKRAVEEDEEEKIEEKRRKRSMFKSYPGDEEDRDLDALLSQVAKPKIKDEDEDGEVKKEPEPAAEEPIAAKETVDGVEIKPDPEPSAEAKAGPALSNMPTAADAPVKQEDGQPTGGIVFKKRKAKNIRQK